MFWILLYLGQATAVYQWSHTARGSVKIVSDINRTYTDAESFCHSEGAAGILPLARVGDPDLLGKLNNQLEFWVADPTNQPGGVLCDIYSYSPNVGNWLVEKRKCVERHHFLCAQKLQMTSSLTLATAFLTSLPTPNAFNTMGETTTSTKSTPPTTPVSINAFSNIKVNNSVLYIDYDPMTYQNASLFCQLNFNGNLAASDIILSVGTGLGNYLSRNQTYWLQGKTKGQCSVLYNDGNSSSWNTSSNQCVSQLPFICRESNVTSPTSPSFMPSTNVALATLVSAKVTTLSSSQRPTGWHVIGESEYRLSSGGCNYTSAEQCCHAIGGSLSPTLGNATLSKVVKILPKFGHNGKIWITGTSCILGHVVPSCDVLAIVNGKPLYDKSDVKEYHFCLCTRPTTPVHDRVACKEFYQNWERIGRMEFWKSGKPRTYKRAEEQCQREGGNLVDPSWLPDPHFVDAQLKNSYGAFWIKSGNATSTCSAIIVHKKQLHLANKTCSSWLYSICERFVSNSTTTVTTLTRPGATLTSNATTDPPVPGWQRNQRHEYYVTYDYVTNREADTYCRDRLNSSLTFFTVAKAYFKIAETLNLHPGKYWVGTGLEPSSNDSCLLLRIQDWNTSSLLPTDCADRHHSICRRPVKNETMTFEPEFLQMLQEMTVTGKSTQKQRRKLTSATNYRNSSTAMGIVGLGVVLLVSLIIVGFDLSNLEGCSKRRRRTMPSSTA